MGFAYLEELWLAVAGPAVQVMAEAGWLAPGVFGWAELGELQRLSLSKVLAMRPSVFSSCMVPETNQGTD